MGDNAIGQDERQTRNFLLRFRDTQPDPSPRSIVASIEARKPDFDAYIDPQKEKADCVILVEPTELAEGDKKTIKVRLVSAPGRRVWVSPQSCCVRAEVEKALCNNSTVRFLVVICCAPLAATELSCAAENVLAHALPWMKHATV